MVTKTYSGPFALPSSYTSLSGNFKKKQAEEQPETKKNKTTKLLSHKVFNWILPVEDTASLSKTSLRSDTDMNPSELLSFLSSQGFKIKNKEKVKSFFGQNHALIKHFYSLPDKIAKHFTEPKKKIIKISEGLEEGEPEETLIIDLYTKLPADKAVEKLDNLDKAWLMPLYSSTKIYNVNTLISYL